MTESRQQPPIDQDRRIQDVLQGVHRLMAGDFSVSESVDESQDDVGEVQRQLRLLAGKLQENAEVGLTAELLRVRKALELSNAEYQQFAYVVSHDLQAPLRAIAGFSSLLKDDYHDRLDDAANEYIDHITSSVDRMQQQIRDLLLYSRVQSQGSDFATVDLNEVFDEALSLLSTSIDDAKGIVTRDDLPTVCGDRRQLCQHFQNMLDNSVKFRSERPLEIHASAKKTDGKWTIALRDNGIGIAENNHESIFLVFRRLHTREEYPGTGIGLAICNRIVNRHGGKMWVESALEQGSTFLFTIAEAS